MHSAHLTNTSTNEEDTMSSPTSDNLETALGGSKEADKESEASIPKVKSGIDLAPLDNIVASVNGNLKDCQWCKGEPPVLELDRRIGFASNWKLSCRSCVRKDKKLDYNIQYLKRKLEDCSDHKERREVKLTINHNERDIKKG